MRYKRRVLLLLNAYDQPTHQAAVDAARQRNWHLDTNVLTPMGMMNHWRGDGILSSLTDNPRTANFVQQNPGIPCVDLSTWREDIPLPRVAADNTAIGRMAARHFMAYGHRNFAWYASTPTPFGEARFAAFNAELKAHTTSATRIDGPGSLNYNTMADRLKNLPRPCSIFAVNDADAAWIAGLCMEEGFQVPMDFSILGVDNNPMVCEVQSVALSSIDRDTAGVVQEGARLLQAAMDGKRIPASTTFIAPKGVATRASSDAFIIDDDIVRRAMRHLQNRLAEKIGTPEIAEELGVSRSLLNQRFKTATNSTLHQTLMNMRLNQAADLLTSTAWNMDRIAAATGFTHASHLSNSFKRHFGQSPLTYRKEFSG
ncbi:helix-turn-helix domain-containing protein [Pontiellaceae bacterium B12227]|nr:helix-turn-helix domain-containing protein [Pontiellaceae bacterium B12227]